MIQELTLHIILVDPPPNIHFGLQKGNGSNYETVQTKISNSGDLQFNLEVKIKTDKEKNALPNFSGPFVQGPTAGKFIYIDIGTCAGQKDTAWSRRLKIPLTGIGWDIIDTLHANPDMILKTRVPGTGKDGGPACATVKPFDGWKLSVK